MGNIFKKIQCIFITLVLVGISIVSTNAEVVCKTLWEENFDTSFNLSTSPNYNGAVIEQKGSGVTQSNTVTVSEGIMSMKGQSSGNDEIVSYHKDLSMYPIDPGVIYVLSYDFKIPNYTNDLNSKLCPILNVTLKDDTKVSLFANQINSGALNAYVRSSQNLISTIDKSKLYKIKYEINFKTNRINAFVDDSEILSNVRINTLIKESTIKSFDSFEIEYSTGVVGNSCFEVLHDNFKLLSQGEDGGGEGENPEETPWEYYEWNANLTDNWSNMGKSSINSGNWYVASGGDLSKNYAKVENSTLTLNGENNGKDGYVDFSNRIPETVLDKSGTYVFSYDINLQAFSDSAFSYNAPELTVKTKNKKNVRVFKELIFSNTSARIENQELLDDSGAILKNPDGSNVQNPATFALETDKFIGKWCTFKHVMNLSEKTMDIYLIDVQTGAVVQSKTDFPILVNLRNDDSVLYFSQISEKLNTGKTVGSKLLANYKNIKIHSETLSVTNILPAKNESGVPIEKSITVTFDDELDTNSISNNNIGIYNSENTNVMTSYDVNKNILTLNGKLDYSTQYTVKIDSSIKGRKFFGLKENFQSNFTTISEKDASYTLKAIDAFSYMNSKINNGVIENVNIDECIYIVFNEDIDEKAIIDNILIKKNNEIVNVQPTLFNNNTIKIENILNWDKQSTYNVMVKKELKTLQNHSMKNDFIFDFKTKNTNPGEMLNLTFEDDEIGKLPLAPSNVTQRITNDKYNGAINEYNSLTVENSPRGDGKALKISGGSSSVGISYAFDEKANDIIEYSFDTYFQDDNQRFSSFGNLTGRTLSKKGFTLVNCYDNHPNELIFKYHDPKAPSTAGSYIVLKDLDFNGKWHTIKFILNRLQRTFDIYEDGKLLNSNVLSIGCYDSKEEYDKISNIDLIVSAISGSAKDKVGVYWFDNIKLNTKEALRVENVIYNKGTLGALLDTDVKFKFNKNIDESTINAVVSKGTQELPKDDYTIVCKNNEIVISFKNILDYKTNYDIKFSYMMKSSDDYPINMKEDYNFTLCTQVPPFDFDNSKVVCDGVIVDSLNNFKGKSIDYSFKLTNYKSAQIQNYVAVVCLKDEQNKLVKSYVESDVLNLEKEKVIKCKFEVPNDEHTYRMELFLWDGLSTGNEFTDKITVV